jgi:hypothetical protein
LYYTIFWTLHIFLSRTGEDSTLWLNIATMYNTYISHISDRIVEI